jgi:hypothetical protein
MKTVTLGAPLQSALEQMSRDMAVSVEGLVNQAVFNWAKLHGYAEPGHPAAALKRQPRFVLVLKDREVPIDSERFLVGRDVSCDLTIEAPRISRQHAVLHLHDDFVELEDLGSSNGTWCQGLRVERRKLVHGDEVQFGDVPVRLELR